MFHRFVPMMFFMAPRFLPVIIRYIRLIWRLTFDRRVHVVLRALAPLAIIYVISPIDLAHDWKVPFLGKADDVIVLGLAALLLTKLAPQHVVDEHLGKPPISNRPEDKDPSKVVDGSARLIDEK
tara:strand:- start:414 stop:785 length:372 start_codon:yes stop_codon:yes gene_type:complete